MPIDLNKFYDTYFTMQDSLMPETKKFIDFLFDDGYNHFDEYKIKVISGARTNSQYTAGEITEAFLMINEKFYVYVGLIMYEINKIIEKM